MANSVAEQIIRRYDKLDGGLGTWRSHWEEVADRVLPRYASTMTAGAGDSQTRGEKRTEKMFDSTAALGLERFAAAMESMLTPRNQQWHRLTTSDPYLNRDRETKLWFEEATRVLFKHRYAPKANYASQQHEAYMGLGAFGTAAILTERNEKGGGLRYRALNLREVVFDMSSQGIVDTVYRKYTLKARQVSQRVDSGFFTNAPDTIAKDMKENPDKEYSIIHCVKPREEAYGTGRIDSKGMPFASYYVLVNEKEILFEGGYNTFPYAISRYVTGPGEIYGRSPAMMALPSIKVLNEQKKTMLKQGHRVVDPVLLTHDDGIIDTFSLTPGAINAGGVNASGQRLVHELPTGNLAAGQELMDMERSVINDAFLVSLFQILVESPAMTATEVLERAREKGALLSPTMGRQQSEMLGPMIEREVDLLMRQEMFPPLPPALIEAEGEFEIEYDSPLTRSQRAEEAAGWLRTLEAAIAYSNTTQDLSALDHFNVDVIYPALAEINAVPTSWMNSAEAVQAAREQRAQQSEMQQMVEAAPAAAGVMKALQ
jgi:hypothetical protein|tara:strand:+ start:145 stop:1773 length:1629 start_codon:yes stop_codon:yes gene_type:complete